MKKIIAVYLLVGLMVGCILPPVRQLSPEQMKVQSVADTAGCKFLQPMYCEVLPYNMAYWVSLNTHNAGGDSYKIINTHSFWSEYEGQNRLGVNFEIYKCR